MNERALLDQPVFQVKGEPGVSDRQVCKVAEALLLQLAEQGIYAGLESGCRQEDIFDFVAKLSRYDLLLVCGDSSVELQQIHLRPSCSAGAPEAAKNADAGTVVRVEGSVDVGLNIGVDVSDALEQLLGHLQQMTQRTPVWACVLIGGRSSRMGRPKHLLPADGYPTWLERTVASLQPLVDGIALSGRGDVPDSLGELPRLPDVPGVVGPLTGLLSAGRWQPRVSWLLAACDMPFINEPAVKWLLSQRRSGRWAVVPRSPQSGRKEPLFAWYDYRAMGLVERLAFAGELRISRLAEDEKILTPTIPDELGAVWTNVNTPEQFTQLSR